MYRNTDLSKIGIQFIEKRKKNSVNLPSAISILSGCFIKSGYLFMIIFFIYVKNIHVFYYVEIQEHKMCTDAENFFFVVNNFYVNIPPTPMHSILERE